MIAILIIVTIILACQLWFVFAIKNKFTIRETIKRQTVKPIQKVPEKSEPIGQTSIKSYPSAFLKKNEFKTRQCVYISQQTHMTISKIVHVIADKNVTVGGYIDNVLLQHLEANKDEINELYKKDRKDLIE